MTGKENVLIKKKTLKIIIVLVLLDIFFAEFVFQYGAQPTLLFDGYGNDPVLNIDSVTHHDFAKKRNLYLLQ